MQQKSFELFLPVLILVSFTLFAQGKDTLLFKNIEPPTSFVKYSPGVSETFNSKVSSDVSGNYVVTLQNLPGIAGGFFSLNLFSSNDSLKYKREYDFGDTSLTDMHAKFNSTGNIFIVYGLKTNTTNIIRCEEITPSGEIIQPPTDLRKEYSSYTFANINFEFIDDGIALVFSKKSNSGTSECYLQTFNSKLLSVQSPMFITSLYSPQIFSSKILYSMNNDVLVLFSNNTTTRVAILREGSTSLQIIYGITPSQYNSGIGDFYPDQFGNNWFIYAVMEDSRYKLKLDKYTPDFSEKTLEKTLLSNNEFKYKNPKIFINDEKIEIVYNTEELPDYDLFFYAQTELTGALDITPVAIEATQQEKKIESLDICRTEEKFKLFYTDIFNDRSYTYFQAFDPNATVLAGRELMGNERVYTDRSVKVDKDSSGNFLVSWTHYENNSTIFCQRFDKTGKIMGEPRKLYNSFNNLASRVFYLGNDMFRILWHEVFENHYETYSALYSFQQDSVLLQCKFANTFNSFDLPFNYILDIDENRHLFLTWPQNDKIMIESYSSTDGTFISAYPVNIIDGVLTKSLLGLFVIKAEPGYYYVIWEGSKDIYAPDVYIRKIDNNGVPVEDEGKVLIHFGNPYNFKIQNIQYLNSGLMMFTWEKSGSNNYKTVQVSLVDTTGTGYSNAMVLSVFPRTENNNNEVMIKPHQGGYFALYRDYYEPTKYVMQYFDLEVGAFCGPMNFWDTDEAYYLKPQMFFSGNEIITFSAERKRNGTASILKMRKDIYEKRALTGIENKCNIEKFSLLQNYPNPFNPATTISFYIPLKSEVTITIFNLLGEIVQRFDNLVYSAGNQQVKFNGENLSSGIYFYAINATSLDGTRNFSEVKKMILMK